MNCEKAKRKSTNFRMGDFPFFLLTAVGTWQIQLGKKAWKKFQYFSQIEKVFEIKLEIEIEFN
jgi:hypothetical protein